MRLAVLALPLLPLASAVHTSEIAQRLRPVPAPQKKRTTPTAAAPAAFFTPHFANPAAADFHVNSSALPLVDFALQDSWAGRLPVSNKPDDDRRLFFWYWPAGTANASDTLTIWLNGGPGCSSLTGFLQENGPISFQPGASAPSPNPLRGRARRTWYGSISPSARASRRAPSTSTTSSSSAMSSTASCACTYFTFDLPVLSSGGVQAAVLRRLPRAFIASRILHASAAEQAALPLDVQGLLINDGVYSSFVTNQEAPIASFAAANQEQLGLSNEQIAQYEDLSAYCGYDELLAQVTYPRKGKIRLPEGFTNECDIWDQFYEDAMDANECFDVYRFTDRCPTPSDTLDAYFSRDDVQAALHVADSGSFSVCSNDPVFVDNIDDSPYSETLFPDLLARLPHGITLWHGLLDSLLLNVGDRITLQNLTWNGAQGFKKPPTVPLVVHGTRRGVYRSERGLTYIEVDGAGHMIPGDQPETALHVFRSVLGQVAL